MTDDPNVYSEKHVRTLTGLEPVRKLPTAYLPDTENAGLTHQGKEIIDNGLDELSQMLHAMLAAGLLIITICRDIARGSYQLIIRDNGRGIPIGALVRIMTQMNTSGKYDNLVYTASAGQFGLGFKVAAGTSRKMRSITYRPDGVGSLLIEEGVHPDKPTITAPIGETGTTVVYEPDATIFTGIPEYADTGYISLLNLLKKYVFFVQYPIEFRLSESPMPEEFWTLSNAKATKMIREVEAKAELVWSAAAHDRLSWIRHYWNVTRPFHWEWAFHKTTPPKDRLQSFSVQLFYAKFEVRGDVFGMVNNVPIDNPTSNHLSVLSEELAKAIAPRIAEKEMRLWFLESYKVPLFIAVDVKYDEAKFSGTTKSGFISADFRDIYRAELIAILSKSDAVAKLDELYALIEDDIQSRYMQSLSGVSKTKINMNRLFMDLKRPEKFHRCATKNRALAELFLVEGESAGGATGHDTENQAIYLLSGKPKNVISGAQTQHEMVAAFLKFDIYRDICTIINFDPAKPNLNALNFGRCFLMADGDPHGRHIAALLIGAFWVAAPSLVQAGFFGIVAPPYYEVWAGRKKTASTYVRDQEDLIQWKALNIYDHYISIDIEYVTATGGQAKARLTADMFILFMTKIAEIGMAIENLSNEFSLPGLLVEALTRVTYYLTQQTMNVEEIKKALGANRVEFDRHLNTLIVSVGREDYVIPLYNVADRICDQVSRILQALQWRNWNIYVTSKRHSEYHDRPVSIYQLYEMMKHMDRLITVKILKGIGSMNSEDAAKTCMDVRNRRVYNITEPGDVERIYALLGDDPQPRKDLRSSPPLTDIRRVRL